VIGDLGLHGWGYVALFLGLGDVCGLGVEYADLFFFLSKNLAGS
jgi:hypothetical protein